jgi:hypothetical protein
MAGFQSQSTITNRLAPMLEREGGGEGGREGERGGGVTARGDKEIGERREGIQIETYASSLRREKEDKRRVTAAIESIDERQSLLRQDCPIEAKGRPGPHNCKGLDRIQHGSEVGDDHLPTMRRERAERGLTIFP